MENPRFPSSLFTAGVLCLLAVLVLDLASGPCATGADIAELKARAEQGDAEAQYNLGVMYLTVKGCPRTRRKP